MVVTQIITAQSTKMYNVHPKSSCIVNHTQRYSDSYKYYCSILLLQKKINICSIVELFLLQNDALLYYVLLSKKCGATFFIMHRMKILYGDTINTCLLCHLALGGGAAFWRECKYSLFTL